MKVIRTVLVSLALLLAFAGRAVAQEKPKVSLDVPLKILVVFSEYDGEKKISSMPYTLSVLSSEDRDQTFANLRMGIKVPILTQAKDSPQVQYQDVGIAIDCQVKLLEEGRFRLNLSFRRSSVYVPEGIISSKEAFMSAGEMSGRPVIRDLSGRFITILRDTETKQSSVATDPLTGHVVKVDVTLNVVK